MGFIGVPGNKLAKRIRAGTVWINCHNVLRLASVRRLQRIGLSGEPTGFGRSA